MPRISPFTPEQESSIVLKYGELKSFTRVRRWFRIEYNVQAFDVPSEKQFRRIVGRFKETNTTAHGKPPGRPIVAKSAENVQRIREMITEDMTLSIRKISAIMMLAFGTVWTILRKNLKLYPYTCHNTIPLTDVNKETRVDFCEWLLSQPEGFPDKVFFSDEKMFEERSRPNKQNERYWCNVDPEVEDANRVQGGRKLMCWAGLIDGRVVIHWFDEDERINQHIYLNMLQTVVWPAVSAVATRRGYWFQQDGARPHTTNMVLDWLATKFGNRIISNHSARIWPPRSPDLSPLDYWFWGICLAELR